MAGRRQLGLEKNQKREKSGEGGEEKREEEERKKRGLGFYHPLA